MKQRTLSFLVAAATLTCLAGCPVTQVNRLPRSAALLQPEAIPVAGEYRHTPSGYVFPVQVGAFSRVAVLQYHTKGLDVSAGYDDPLPGCPVLLTIYAYPTPRMTFIGADPAVVRSLESQWLEGAYGAAKREIVQAHPRANLESEDSKTQEGTPGKKAVYSIGTTQSELFVFVVGHAWFLKYRVSYPGSCSAEAREALGTFFSTWKGRGD